MSRINELERLIKMKTERADGFLSDADKLDASDPLKSANITASWRDEAAKLKKQAAAYAYELKLIRESGSPTLLDRILVRLKQLEEKVDAISEVVRY